MDPARGNESNLLSSNLLLFQILLQKPAALTWVSLAIAVNLSVAPYRYGMPFGFARPSRACLPWQGPRPPAADLQDAGRFILEAYVWPRWRLARSLERLG